MRRVGSVKRVSTVMGMMGLVLILSTAGFIAWRERELAVAGAADHARDNAFFLADHASRLFEVSDIALRATASALGSDSWEVIANSRQMWSEMRATSAALPYIADLWLNDATGRLRLTTFSFPAPPSDASGRAPFDAVLNGNKGMVIGDAILGRVTDKPTFLVARRLEWPDGSLRGMVSVTADLDYFTGYWSRLDLRDGEHLAIVLEGSGDTLLRFPSPATDAGFTVPGKDALFAAAAASRSAGEFTSAPGAFGFYHRIGSLPLLMVVMFRQNSVLAAWHAWLWRFLPFPLTALAALAGIMAIDDRQGRAEARARLVVDRARADLWAANQRLEERVAERTAELRESNEEIQRFAYIMSHDLRAPLVNIMGFTSELQKLRDDLFAIPSDAEATRTGVDPAALRADFDESIAFIQSSIGKMDRLIRAILALSRNGQRRFDPEPIDMNALMRSVADSVAHRTQSIGASFAIGSLPGLTGDRVAIEQVFSNLIDNAVKYLRPGIPGAISITGVATGGRAVFTVRDNGRGIAARDMSRVFDLFRRAGPQDQPGEGIGLAHVRSLVRRLGGAVTLDSELGKGSTFTVSLPIVPEETPG